jgi:SP family arabinose:H+ symporter-like MFS transporter
MRFAVRIALIVALGGFLMGFDASVISGVVGFIEVEFALSKLALGWGVASLTLTATLAMMVAGPLSDRIGRRTVLSYAAVLFTLSAVASALAPSFLWLVLARMVGGVAVGAALIIAPMYIAEMAPPAQRGRLVSFNQLNIVLGISAAFFSNYLILKLGQVEGHALLAWLRVSDWNWRWMLALEALPAVLYMVALQFVPESPRWLAMRGRDDEARAVMLRVASEAQVNDEMAVLKAHLASASVAPSMPLSALFASRMRLVMIVGVSIAILQQITGINSVFFYAPLIFEQSGIGTDAAFMQAVMVGLTNLAFTVLAMMLIDRVGRRPLLLAGVGGVTLCLLLLALGFSTATYTLTPGALAGLPEAVDSAALATLEGRTFDSDIAFKAAVIERLGAGEFARFESALLAGAIRINATLILVGILGFVASFAISLGPVMWVLFSELFPNRIRGLAISFVGLVNSAVSFLVQLVFPWQLATIGNAATFAIYAGFAVLGLLIMVRTLPETKGKSLEQLETLLAGEH